MRWVRWEEVKYDGSLHRGARVIDLGLTDAGRWLYIPRGTHVDQPNRGGFDHPCNAVVLVPTEGWWTAVWLAGYEPALYIDIAQHMTVDGDRIVTMDLDVDVVRHRDGTVEVLDLDEFEDHRRLYGYTDDVIATVETVTEHLVTAVGDRRPPFGLAPASPPHHLLPTVW